MKTVIIAINSKYIHASLAPWYLKAACRGECGEVRVLEHTINENLDTILASIYRQRPDVAAFSCYIWNISYVLKLAASLKKLMPGTAIVLGGPEASYDVKQLLGENPFIDYILAGEGEISFPKLLHVIQGENPAGGVEGLYRRNDFMGDIEGLYHGNEPADCCPQPAVVENLDTIPSPYTQEMFQSLKNRIVYFEASRGCPFSCSYCLSSAFSGTRFFSLERVFSELDRLVSWGVKQVKFVDRTFNCNPRRAMAIVRHILELDEKARKQNGEGMDCNFHFEVGADLFDTDFIQLLKKAPAGLFQLEAGVQTANFAALEAVNRKTDLGKLFENISEIRAAGNVHIHADLITGLPYEDYRSFANSFNRTFEVRPHQLQLGFLKFLKGTAMREHAEEAGYLYNDYAPYEILCGKYIGYEELTRLKGIAELVERYYNSSRFVFSMEYLLQNVFKSPFDLFEQLLSYYEKQNLFELPAGVRELYAVFDRFADIFLQDEEISVFREYLRLDFLASDSSGTLPYFLARHTSREFQDQCFAFLKGEGIREFIPGSAGVPSKQLFKKVRFMPFQIEISPEPNGIRVLHDGKTSSAVEAGNISERPNGEFKTVLLFNYLSRDRVTGRYPFYSVRF